VGSLGVVNLWTTASFRPLKPNPGAQQATARPSYSPAVYERHSGEISLHMSHFLLDYLRAIYAQFDGDLALVIVLGEIAHHNTAQHFTAAGLDSDALRRLRSEGASWQRLNTCNAYSLAQATGLPRETIRRKIADLEKRGWVERVAKRGVRITPVVAQHFQPDFNLKLLTGLLHTADRIRGLLAT